MELVRPLLALVAVSLATACSRARLDEDLCPIDPKPEHTTVLLLDTSDPLTPKHREALRRLIGELQQPSKAEGTYALHKIEPGEEFVVYELAASVDDLKPAFRVCNPGGSPDTWTIADDLTKGRVIALRRWQRFLASVEPLFAEQPQNALARSLILESLGVITARHAPSRRQLMEGAHRIHLVLFSDLLQHSDALSHYGNYPEAGALRQQAGLRHLQSDLSAVDVSIYRLESARDARWQTTEHYYWWQDLVEVMDGRVIWIEAI